MGYIYVHSDWDILIYIHVYICVYVIHTRIHSHVSVSARDSIPHLCRRDSRDPLYSVAHILIAANPLGERVPFRVIPSQKLWERGTHETPCTQSNWNSIHGVLLNPHSPGFWDRTTRKGTLRGVGGGYTAINSYDAFSYRSLSAKQRLLYGERPATTSIPWVFAQLQWSLWVWKIEICSNTISKKDIYSIFTWHIYSSWCWYAIAVYIYV